MTVLRKVCPVVLILLMMTVVFATTVSRAGIGDKLKKKAGDKANKTADDALKKTDATTSDDAAAPAEDEKEPASSPAGNGDVSAVSTKFDFIPGDRVVLYDDFTQDELGEFPVHWKLVGGTFEVADMDGERWLRCVSNDGHIRMKLPSMQALPEYWTLEFDFYCTEPMGSALTVAALGEGERDAWRATYPQGRDLAFTTGSIESRTTLEAPDIGGRHHVMFMARGTGVKAYIDEQRMASVPEISTAAGQPSALQFRLWSPNKPMITNVRFAEGNKPVEDPFADGKLITYGIYFDSGSDVVQPESAPVLRQIAAYLDAKPDVKLQITGHTDSQGVAAQNVDLSRRRAASVAKVLADQFQIAADRFQTDGAGDSQSISSNDTPEGRAMNRRVEFTKL